MKILYNYYYENSSSDENNYSVCVLFTQGSKNFLMTGDLEADGESALSQQ
jgi:beta-lactamase superfamily II metal-dependent hydrolase